MQTMLRMIGYGENIGTGFATIVKTWDNAHWMQPQLREDSELMKIELSLWKKKPDVTDKTPKNVGVNVGVNVADGTISLNEVNLSARQQIMLGLMKLNNKITAKEMSQIMSVEKRTVERDLATLQKQNIIKRHGADKNGYWEVLI